jgi:hypothetical protein
VPHIVCCECGIAVEVHAAAVVFDIQENLGDGGDPDPRIRAETVRPDQAGWNAALEIAGRFALDADLFKEVCDLLGLLLAMA